MACKKSELISAINSFGSARVSGDSNLINFAANLIGSFIETLEFEPEEEKQKAETKAADVTEEG
jgi:hypothetical protein